MYDFEKLKNAQDLVDSSIEPKNVAEAVARFWGRAILHNSLNDEEMTTRVIDGLPTFMAVLETDLVEAILLRPNLLEGEWGKSALMVGSEPSIPLKNTARECGIPAEAFPTKSSLFDNGSGVVFGHIGIDGPIEQIWPPVPTQQVTGEIGQ